MRTLTKHLLWLFVFTVPWDQIPLPVVGALSRLAGLAALATALLTTVLEGRFRKPDAIFGVASAYIAFCGVSLLWTISYPETIQLVFTGIQVLGSIWLVKEFARTADDQQSLLVAFCIGEFVPLAGVLNSFVSGAQVAWLRDRYTTMGINADDLGLTLAIGVPMAWHLMMTYSGPLRRTVRAIALIYFATAPVAILLTGTRGAVLAGLAGLSIVPLTLPQRSLRSFFLIAGMLIIVAGVAAVVVPQRTWARVFSIKSQLTEGGTMSGRTDIWRAGLNVFPDRPVLGAGAGTFGAAVEPLLNKRAAPHNLPIGMLVEQGIVGLCIYGALLGACAVAIARMPSPQRSLWAALMMSWLVGVMSLNWEYRKVTWLLFALVAAQNAGERVRLRVSTSQRHRTDAPVRRRPRRNAYAPSVDQRAIP